LGDSGKQAQSSKLKAQEKLKAPMLAQNAGEGATRHWSLLLGASLEL
jgi:hypothetical protein